MNLADIFLHFNWSSVDLLIPLDFYGSFLSWTVFHDGQKFGLWNLMIVLNLNASRRQEFCGCSVDPNFNILVDEIWYYFTRWVEFAFRDVCFDINNHNVFWVIVLNFAFLVRFDGDFVSWWKVDLRNLGNNFEGLINNIKLILTYDEGVENFNKVIVSFFYFISVLYLFLWIVQPLN